MIQPQPLRTPPAPTCLQASPDGGLLQAATVADRVSFSFADGEALVPGAYIEFAERRVLPQYAHLEVRGGWRCTYSVVERSGVVWWVTEHARAAALRQPCAPGMPPHVPPHVPPPCLPARPPARLRQPEEVQERHRRDGFEASSADRIFESTSLAAQE